MKRLKGDKNMQYQTLDIFAVLMVDNFGYYTDKGVCKLSRL